jgi:hypothetical protein
VMWVGLMWRAFGPGLLGDLELGELVLAPLGLDLHVPMEPAGPGSLRPSRRQVFGAEGKQPCGEVVRLPWGMGRELRPRLPHRSSELWSSKPRPFWTEEWLGWSRTTHPVREVHESDRLTASGLRIELGVWVHAQRADARFLHSMNGS